MQSSLATNQYAVIKHDIIMREGAQMGVRKEGRESTTRATKGRQENDERKSKIKKTGQAEQEEDDETAVGTCPFFDGPCVSSIVMRDAELAFGRAIVTERIRRR